MGETTFKIIQVIFYLFFAVFIAAIFIFIREYRIKKRLHLKKLERMDLQHKKELLETQTEIQQETMKYIGREIHDNVGQKLTLSSLYLQQLLFENKAPNVNTKLDEVNTIINASLQELRNLSKSLTDDTIENSTLSELFRAECEKLKSLKSYEIIFDDELNVRLSSYQIKSILVRVVQEFIQNSIKHAEFKTLQMSISNSKDVIMLKIKDDGKGFNVEKYASKGIGLKNMKKRIELINGNFELKSSASGTELILKIPINEV